MSDEHRDILKEIEENVEAAERIVERRINKNKELGPGIKEGKMFYVPVADGQAYYTVTIINETKTMARVDYLEGASPDGYMDLVLDDGGWFPYDTIERLVERTDAFEGNR